jgi:hypothetical protein
MLKVPRQRTASTGRVMKVARSIGAGIAAVRLKVSNPGRTLLSRQQPGSSTAVHRRQAAAAAVSRRRRAARGGHRSGSGRQAAGPRQVAAVSAAVSRRWHRTAVTSAGAPAIDQLHCNNERRRPCHPRFDRGCTRRVGLLHSVPTCTAALVADGCRATASDAFTCDWFGGGRCTQVKVALAAGLSATVTRSCPCSRLSVTRTTSART